MTRPNKRKRGKKKLAYRPSIASWFELWRYLTPTSGEYIRHFELRDKKQCYMEMEREASEYRDKHPGCYVRVEVRKVNVNRWAEYKTNEPPLPS